MSPAFINSLPPPRPSKRLLIRSPPDTHVGSHTEIQHLHTLRIDDELAKLGPLATVAAASFLLTELRIVGPVIGGNGGGAFAADEFAEVTGQLGLAGHGLVL